MRTIEDVLKDKESLCKVRDSLANIYNEYIQILVKNENNPEVYEDYVKKIEALEPETRLTKEKMRELNRELQTLGFKSR